MPGPSSWSAGPMRSPGCRPARPRAPAGSNAPRPRLCRGPVAARHAVHARGDAAAGIRQPACSRPRPPPPTPAPTSSRPRTRRASPPRPGRRAGQALLAYILTSGPRRCATSPRRRWYRKAAGPPDWPGLCRLRPRAAAQGGVAGESRPGRMCRPRRPNTRTRRRDLSPRRANQQGQGVERDPVRADRPVSAGPREGRALRPGALRLALLEAVARDLQDRKSWPRKAALAGDPEAAALIGTLSARRRPAAQSHGGRPGSGAPPMPHRPRRARSGVLHLTGAGVPRDPAKAARWFHVSRPTPGTCRRATTSRGSC